MSDIRKLLENIDRIEEEVYESVIELDEDEKITCYDCDGTGHYDGDPTEAECDTCDGNGWIWGDKVEEGRCWDGYEPVPGKKAYSKGSCRKKGSKNESLEEAVLAHLAESGYDTDVMEAEYQGRKVKLNKPMAGDVKKFKVYVKDPKTGNVKKVNFGQKGVKIKKNNPERRKSFRARHNCDQKKDKTTAGYWSCRKW